jgi:hypothetical protein
MTTARTATAAVPAFEPECIAWDDFVREIPDRAVRRVVEQRDAVESASTSAARTQSWAPGSIRSGWAPELRDVVEAIDALEAAHAEIADAESADEHEALVEARSDAFEALCDAIAAAEHKAFCLAARVAELEAEEGIEDLLWNARIAVDDADWQAELAERLDRHPDGDRGWTVTRAEDGALVVTGWAMPRYVEGDDCGGLVLGVDEGVEEHECRGRVAFQVTRDADGSDEPNGLCATVAEAVEAVEALAAVHGVADWSEAWVIRPRWVPQTKAELVDEIMALLGGK